MYLGGLSIAILLSSKTEFGYEAKATPPHLNPGRASTFFCQPDKVPLLTSPVHSLIPSWRHSSAPPCPGYTWEAHLWHCRAGSPLASNTGSWNSKEGHACTLDELSCSSTWKAGCRESAYSPDATRSYTAASTGKGAAGEQQLLIQEPIYCFWKQAGKSTGHHMLLLQLRGYALKKWTVRLSLPQWIKSWWKHA